MISVDVYVGFAKEMRRPAKTAAKKATGNSRLLPKRPAGVGFPPRTEDSVVPTPAAEGTPTQTASISSPEAVAEEVSTKLDNAAVKGEGEAEDEDWTWEQMEAERLRGLKMASHFDQLSGIHDEIRAGEVLGQYSDWF